MCLIVIQNVYFKKEKAKLLNQNNLAFLHLDTTWYRVQIN